MQAAIIEAALNGATPKSKFPNVPRSSDEIVGDALHCIDAGASIIHTHIEERGLPAARTAEVYAAHFAPILAVRPDALVYPTVGFAASVEESLGHLTLLKRHGVRIGLIEPGSVNLGNFAYVNTPNDIRYMVELCSKQELAPSISIYEPGFLRRVLRYWRRSQLPRGAFIKFYLGGTHADASFGLLPTPRMLDVYLDILAECPLPWSVGVLGGDVFEHGLARHALERGGHLHVGLEDYAGPEYPTNVKLVLQAAALCQSVGRPIATPAETAVIVDIP